MECNMQKMVFTFTAIGLATVLSSVANQKLEAATLSPAAIVQSSSSGTVLADWNDRDHRRHWRFLERRRHRDHDYGYRHEGYRYCSDYEGRVRPREVYEERRGY